MKLATSPRIFTLELTEEEVHRLWELTGCVSCADVRELIKDCHVTSTAEEIYQTSSALYDLLEEEK